MDKYNGTRIEMGEFFRIKTEPNLSGHYFNFFHMNISI